MPLGAGRYDWGLSTPSPSLPSVVQGRMALGPESYGVPSLLKVSLCDALGGLKELNALCVTGGARWPRGRRLNANIFNGIILSLVNHDSLFAT